MVKLAARSLVFDYPGPLRAVDDVDVEIGGGELVCVLGPNGAGKSTLLKLFAGLVPAASGGVTIDGAEIASLSARERARRIAVVPQSLRSVPDAEVRNFVLGGRYGHLGFWRRAGAEDLAVVERALHEADVAELGDRLLTQLSGGQLQRVLIARALAQESQVLLVDEPTSSLDPEHQLATFRAIARLVGEQRAVVVVTHDFNLASQFATSLCLLAHGRVAARGSADEVLVPEVLHPVYGRHLRFGRWPAAGGVGERPYVVPWLD